MRAEKAGAAGDENALAMSVSFMTMHLHVLVGQKARSACAAHAFRADVLRARDGRSGRSDACTGGMRRGAEAPMARAVERRPALRVGTDTTRSRSALQPPPPYARCRCRCTPPAAPARSAPPARQARCGRTGRAPACALHAALPHDHRRSSARAGQHHLQAAAAARPSATSAKRCGSQRRDGSRAPGWMHT